MFFQIYSEKTGVPLTFVRDYVKSKKTTEKHEMRFIWTLNML